MLDIVVIPLSPSMYGSKFFYASEDSSVVYLLPRKKLTRITTFKSIVACAPNACEAFRYTLTLFACGDTS